jgi:hypothetical protein
MLRDTRQRAMAAGQQVEAAVALVGVFERHPEIESDVASSSTKLKS